MPYNTDRKVDGESDDTCDNARCFLLFPLIVLFSYFLVVGLVFAITHIEGDEVVLIWEALSFQKMKFQYKSNDYQQPQRNGALAGLLVLLFPVLLPSLFSPLSHASPSMFSVCSFFQNYYYYFFNEKYFYFFIIIWLFSIKVL